MSLPCVLVTPKRKLAGQLAVMKDVLHFFGEFLVEGTVGSSVFKNLNASSQSESAQADQKPKSFKWAIHLDINSEKGTSPENIEAEILHKKQFKNVKRHRRWNISKVGNHQFFYLSCIAYISYTNLLSSCLFLLAID